MKKGFTLAEVLITLGIIGVVAALTIPTLMQNADERATITALKKAYSTMSNAFTLAVQEDGTPDTWGLGAAGSNTPAILDKLKPYLKVDKDCTDGSQGCWPAGLVYRVLNGNASVYDDLALPKLRLVDGTLIIGWVGNAGCTDNYGNSPALQNGCGSYWLDINGNKKPNQWGRDVFAFFLTKKGLTPIGSSQDSGTLFSTRCRDKDTQSGDACAAWVIYNDNMDYLHCNNLAWGGKTKCD